MTVTERMLPDKELLSTTRFVAPSVANNKEQGRAGKERQAVFAAVRLAYGALSPNSEYQVGEDSLGCCRRVRKVPTTNTSKAPAAEAAYCHQFESGR